MRKNNIIKKEIKILSQRMLNLFYFFLGCASFVLFVIYDLNQVSLGLQWIRPFFAVGCVLLAVSTMVLTFVGQPIFVLLVPFRAIFGILALLSLGLTIYSLFFALPFKETYIEEDVSNRVYDRGIYALCRHPGVLFFISFYFFHWLYTGKKLMFMAFVVYGLLNSFYAWLQDRFFFERLFCNYDTCRKTTPFLIPTRASVKRSLKG